MQLWSCRVDRIYVKIDPNDLVPILMRISTDLFVIVLVLVELVQACNLTSLG